MTIRCQSCSRTYAPIIPPTLTFAGETVVIHSGPPAQPGEGLLGQAARAAGWMVGEGPTIGGGHVRRVHCPGCLGRTSDGPQVEQWDAECSTCGATASDDEDYGDEPFSKEDAERWKDDHECEPDVRLITPEQVADREARHRKAVAAAEAYLQSGEKAAVEVAS